MRTSQRDFVCLYLFASFPKSLSDKLFISTIRKIAMVLFPCKWTFDSLCNLPYVPKHHIARFVLAAGIMFQSVDLHWLSLEYVLNEICY